MKVEREEVILGFLLLWLRLWLSLGLELRLWGREDGDGVASCDGGREELSGLGMGVGGVLAKGAGGMDGGRGGPGGGEACSWRVRRTGGRRRRGKSVKEWCGCGCCIAVGG